MKIEIHNSRKIFSIQDEFSQSFPNLKMEFYTNAINGTGMPLYEPVTSSSILISDCRVTTNSGSIEIVPGMTTGDLIRVFKNIYGIKIEFVQKSIYSNLNGLWVSEHTDLEPTTKKTVITSTLE